MPLLCLDFLLVLADFIYIFQLLLNVCFDIIKPQKTGIIFLLFDFCEWMFICGKPKQWIWNKLMESIYLSPCFIFHMIYFLLHYAFLTKFESIKCVFFYFYSQWYKRVCFSYGLGLLPPPSAYWIQRNWKVSFSWGKDPVCCLPTPIYTHLGPNLLCTSNKM